MMISILARVYRPASIKGDMCEKKRLGNKFAYI